jgi:hypothetical protein
MMVLLFYFLIAVLTAVTASALIGWFLTNLIGRFKTSDRLSRWVGSLASGTREETHTNPRRWRFECFSRHRTQARLSGVLIQRR